MSESPDLPEVEPRDPEAVAVAIETARALFRTGERLDALRWLRRAAERAEEAGDDVRSVSLARSAADLSTELQSMPPPMGSAPPPAVTSAPPPTSRRHDEAAALAPYDDFADKTAVDVQAPPVVREALQSGVHITELPESQQSPRSVTMPSPSSSIPVVSGNPIAKPAVRPALRVAVSADPRTPGTWLVRPLNEGIAAPAGSEEALLVALDPKTELFD
ncbi:MAG TPA: hypothetical protein VHW01_23245 [Polyangiaceae bacterium]|nr:hypothetical protein [Polyangiaceae bacterium]